jgi:DNA-binding HxlR family transcriptional regulator
MTARVERVVAVEPGTTCDTPGDDGIELADYSAGTSVTGGPQRRKSHRRRRKTRSDELINFGSRAPNPIPLLSRLSPTIDSRSASCRVSQMRRVEPQDFIRHPFLMLHELEHHRGTLEILLLLGGENSATKSRMRRKLRVGQVAIESSLLSLVRMGLVRFETNPGFPFSKSFRLTGRGRTLVDSPLRSWCFAFA